MTDSIWFFLLKGIPACAQLKIGMVKLRNDCRILIIVNNVLPGKTVIDITSSVLVFSFYAGARVASSIINTGSGHCRCVA
jgi:hypothetical protein